MTQAEALAILKTGANVFLTGEPGSGKTHLISEYLSYVRARGLEPAVTASTGIAATHLGGMTIHSWSGIGIKTHLTNDDLQRIASNKPIAKRIRRAHVLVIDEVSMLPAETLSMVEAICRAIKQRSDPFGKMQVVLVGDFFQLPPIMKTEVDKSPQMTLPEPPQARFAYEAPVWERANPTICYLTEQHRQDDLDFLALLAAIRRNAFDNHHLHRLETRIMAHQAAPNGVPKLFSQNADVDRLNDAVLAELSGKPHVFPMTSEGPDALVSALKKGCLSPETLCLKVGAAVMFTKNHVRAGFVNGTLGSIEGFDSKSGAPIVKTRTGRRIEVEAMDWAIEEAGTIRARITQLPLRLAWAMTVHKSQGMSLDEAVVDLRQVFEFGQGYVALSRVRRLSGLHLLGWNHRAFHVHPDVLAKDGQFQAQSEQAVRAFGEMTQNELTTLQEGFIRTCGGADIQRSEKTGSDPPNQRGQGIPRPSGFDKIRATHPQAYRPWDNAQDEKLRSLYGEGASIADLAQAFNRTKGAIRARLAKLGFL